MQLNEQSLFVSTVVAALRVWLFSSHVLGGKLEDKLAEYLQKQHLVVAYLHCCCDCDFALNEEAQSNCRKPRCRSANQPITGLTVDKWKSGLSRPFLRSSGLAMENSRTDGWLTPDK